MENNEQEEIQEEAPETSTEDVKDEEQEKDWKAEALKFKAIADRKDKKLKEALTDDTESEAKETKKPNSEQPLSREETIFFAQGGTEETYKIAKKIADAEGISILAAKEDDYFKFQAEKLANEAKVKANMIGSGSGSNVKAGHEEKPLDKMTREEHEAYVKKRIAG